MSQAFVMRPSARIFQASRAFRMPLRTKPVGRRYQSTGTIPPVGETQSTFQRLWNSPIGVKTVHFWAPVMKWALVIAGISDFYRPVENLSLTQNVALTATGVIWTRWCLIIKPKNYLLAAVNFFLGCVGIVQVGRILTYQKAAKKETIAAQVEDAASAVSADAKSAVKSIAN